jgi:hypothetical protein
MTVTTENLPQTINVNDLEDVEARALRVARLLRKSATLWLDIAKEVADAKQSLSKDAFAIFLKKACLTPAIADKMPTIAKTADLYSDEMKKHIHRFEGWSPIYETAKLKPDERSELISALNKDPEAEVSRKFIQSFRKAKSTSTKSTTLIAEIRFDENDIQRCDYDQFLDLKQKLDDISRIIDRMSPVVLFSQKDEKLDQIETKIINTEEPALDEYDEHCDELLPVTMPAANTDCCFSNVAS